MTTKLSSKGQIVLPAAMRRKMELQTGDPLEIVLEDDAKGLRIVIAPRRKKRGKWKMITDPITGWPALKGPPGTPRLTTEKVKELLADFP